MENKKRNQMVVFTVIGVIALMGVAMMAYMAGQLFNQPEPVATAIVTPAPTPLPPPVVTIAGIQGQAELSAVEMRTVTEIYNEAMPQGWLDSTLGNKEQLLMLVYGDVRAGFDLSELGEGDIWTDGKKVRLVLPAPKLLNSSIDFEQSRIVYYENNLWLDNNNPNLQGEALQQAKIAVEQAALKGGILEQASDFGTLYFENFLYSLGFDEVEVIVDAQIDTTVTE